MNLRKNTLIPIGLTMTVMVVFICLFAGNILLGGYKQIERQDILDETDRTIKTILENPSWLKAHGPPGNSADISVSGTEIKKWEDSSNRHILIHPLDHSALPDDFNQALKTLSLSKTNRVITRLGNTISAYTILKDKNGRPLLICRLDKLRTIYQQGKTRLTALIFSILAVSIVFLIITLLLLDRTVLSRILQLRHEIEHIETTGNLVKRTSVSGKDELSDLSVQINGMLESLRVSTERDLVILDSIEDAYFEFNLDGDLVFFNRFATGIIQDRISDLANINYRQLMDDKTLDRVLGAFKQLYKTGSPIKNLETELIFENGEKRLLESSVSLIKDTEGNKTGFRGIARDITERKNAEARLKKSEERLSLALEVSLAGPWEANLDTKEFSFDEKLFHAFGYQPKDFPKSIPDVLRFIPSQDLPRVRERFIQFAQGAEPLYRDDFQVLTKTGENRWIHNRAKAIQRFADNRPRVIIGAVMDITELKRAEKELREADRQKRQAHKMEAIGTLAGGIAHDFNNILTGIFGYAQLAKNAINLPVRAKGHIDQIMKGADRAAGLIQQILTFSRQREQEKILLNIAIVVKEAIHLMRASIPSTIDIQENIFSKANVLTDPTQIHQVIMNLCTNAYHAMRDNGGVLTVELFDVHLPDAQTYPDIHLAAGDYVTIAVKDTGCGMDEETLQKVFDPYFTTKPAGEGTGLGLSIVYGIVEDHGGLIKAYSSVNQGALFRMFLPVAQASEMPASTIPARMAPGKNERILLVDDEEGVLLSIRQNLKNFGYKVRAFSNPQKALTVFKKNPDQFDLVITDMTMPGMTGDLLTEDILHIRPGMPVILCTGYSEKISKSRAFEMGVRQFIQKPLSMSRLLLIIREVLDPPPK